MDDDPSYRLDIDGLAEDGPAAAAGALSGKRPWVGIRFNCCHVYTRVYRNLEGTAYQARCPFCLRPVTLRVGPEGTNARFFVAEPHSTL
jgi:hypothetical protein